MGATQEGVVVRVPEQGKDFSKNQGENSTLSCSPKTSTGTVLGKIELPHSCCQASGLSLFIPRSQSHRAAGELRPAVEHGSFSSAEGPRGPGKGAEDYSPGHGRETQEREGGGAVFIPTGCPSAQEFVQ